MKFSLITAIFLGAISTVLADIEYFDYPPRGSVFSTSDTITFAVDEVTDDGDDSILAELYYSDGTFVQVIGQWPANRREGPYGDDDFVFHWEVDVGPGEYFVRVFEVDGPVGSDRIDIDDDVNRSYTFTIGDSTSTQSDDKQIATNSRKKRSIYAP